jgi:hypothetical protein
MARSVKFSSNKPKKTRGGDTSFNFGFNTLSKREKRDYNKRQGRRGSAAGGS